LGGHEFRPQKGCAERGGQWAGARGAGDGPGAGAGPGVATGREWRRAGSGGGAAGLAGRPDGRIEP